MASPKKEDIDAAIEDDRWIGIECYLPPCIEGVWEEGASGTDTAKACRLIALYLKDAVNELFKGKGSASTPFESWLEDELGAAPGSNVGRFLDWNKRCHKPIPEKEIIGILYRASDSPRGCPTCKELLRVDSFEINCEEEVCSRLEKPSTKEEKKEVSEKLEEYPDKIVARATDILQNGNPVDFFIQIHQRHHVSDIPTAKILMASFGVTTCLTPEVGIYPKLSGGSGTGKSHCTQSVIHLLPPEWIVSTSLSPKALYRMKGIKPGTIVYCDDMDLSDGIEETLRQAMSDFQLPASRTVVNKDGKEEKFIIPERVVIWLTYVSDGMDLQIINRMFSCQSDESEETDKRVIDHQLRLAQEGRSSLWVDDEVLICRAMMREIKDHAWKVRIPFANRIKWHIEKDRRNLPRLIALICASAALNFAQRNQPEEGVLEANESDFMFAKELFDVRGEALATKLNDIERHLVMFIIEKCKFADGTTLSEILNDFRHNGRQFSRSSLHELIHGSKRHSRGLLDKVPGLDYEKVTISIDSGVTRRQQNVYILHKFDVLDSYADAVTLDSDSDDSFSPFADLSPSSAKGANATCRPSINNNNLSFSSFSKEFTGRKEESENSLSLCNSAKAAKERKIQSGIAETPRERSAKDTRKESHNTGDLSHDLSQYLSEMARKGLAVRVDDVVRMGFDELEILEALDNANWRESTRGWWEPPRRAT